MAQTRGLLASVVLNDHETDGAIRQSREIGVELAIDPVETTAEMLAALERRPGTTFLLADFLPDVAPFDYAGSEAGDEAIVLDRLRGVRWIQLTATGIDQETQSVTWRRAPAVTVTTASGLAAVAMAQYVIESILSHANGRGRLDEFRRSHDWSIANEVALRVLVGRTLGLLGYGAAGRRVAHIARALGMRVVAVRRNPDRQLTDSYRVPAIDALDVGPEPAGVWGLYQLDRLLAASDYLVCAVPLTAETRHLIGSRELDLLPQGAVVINVSRGAVIDESALVAAIRSGHLDGARLDVFETEPLPGDSPLWTLPNVVLTPHIAGSHDRGGSFTAGLFLENLQRFVDGRPLLNIADRQRGY